MMVPYLMPCARIRHWRRRQPGGFVLESCGSRRRSAGAPGVRPLLLVVLTIVVILLAHARASAQAEHQHDVPVPESAASWTWSWNANVFGGLNYQRRKFRDFAEVESQ